jgi:hypothetical protein
MALASAPACFLSAMRPRRARHRCSFSLLRRAVLSPARSGAFHLYRSSLYRSIDPSLDEKAAVPIIQFPIAKFDILAGSPDADQFSRRDNAIGCEKDDCVWIDKTGFHEPPPRRGCDRRRISRVSGRGDFSRLAYIAGFLPIDRVNDKLNRLFSRVERIILFDAFPFIVKVADDRKRFFI